MATNPLAKHAIKAIEPEGDEVQGKKSIICRPIPSSSRCLGTTPGRPVIALGHRNEMKITGSVGSFQFAN